MVSMNDYIGEGISIRQGGPALSVWIKSERTTLGLPASNQALKFGVNDRFVYASVTQSLNE